MRTICIIHGVCGSIVPRINKSHVVRGIITIRLPIVYTFVRVFAVMAMDNLLIKALQDLETLPPHIYAHAHGLTVT
jgi:hypothetical protein